MEEPEEIIDRHREHFQELLQIKKATSEEEKEIEMNVSECFDTVLQIASAMDPIYTSEEDLEKSINGLKLKKCADGTGWKNELIKFGGDGMKESLLILFREMEKERYTPSEWNEMLIKSLHKKGEMTEMDHKRGIFLTNVISKLYETVVKKRDKGKVDARTTKNQVGGKTKRCPADHMIVLVDVLQRNKRLNRKTYLVFGDAVKCFDKLWLRDCLLELYKAGVPPQDIEMLYNLNKEANVKIRTPLGESRSFSCEEIVKQGTVWGPELCCISSDGINRIGENCESNTGKVVFGILGFMDDLFGLGGANKIRKVIRNMRQLEIEKKYTFGMIKTKYMAMETGREEEEEIVEEIEWGVVGKVKEYEYLGLWVNNKADLSCHIEKLGKEIMGEVNGIRVLGSVENVGPLFLCTRLFLYEACIVQSMMHLLETWCTMMKTVELAKLERLQGKILCNLLQLPKTTPYWGILHETGIWSVKWRLAYRAIMLLHNILECDETRLAYEVVKQQISEEYDESFAIYVLQLAAELGIEDLSVLPKSSVKKAVKEGIKKKMEEEITNEVKSKTKLRFITQPVVFGRAAYITDLPGEEAIKVLKIRLNMVDVYGNYKGDLSKRRKCPHCNEESDTTEHLIRCQIGGEKGVEETTLYSTEISGWKDILRVVDMNFLGREK